MQLLIAAVGNAVIVLCPFFLNVIILLLLLIMHIMHGAASL